MATNDIDDFMNKKRSQPAPMTSRPAPTNDVDSFMRGRNAKPKPARPSMEDHPLMSGKLDLRQQPPEGAFSSFQTGLAGPLLRNVVETAADFYNAPGETLERVGRGALEFASAFDPMGRAYEPTVAGQAGRVAELNRGADERLPEAIQSMKRGLAIEGARPRSTMGNLAFGAGSLLGEVAFPTAPESAAANILTAPFAGSAVRTVGRAAAPLVRRLGGARRTAPVEAPPTSRMPIPDAAPTQQLPAIARRLEAESAPTAGLPTRQPAGLPELSTGEMPSLTVGTASPRRQYPSQAGPQADPVLERVTPAAQPLAPPVDPPDLLDGKWARQPQQQPLFDAAAKSPWQDTALAYFRANLLTNPVGRATDFASTVVNQAADAAVRPIAAAVDAIVSRLTGKRSITGPSLSGSGRAFGSIRQGFRDAREVLRTGQQAIDSGADDALYGREIRSGLGRVVDTPINGVFRVLGAMDAPFRRFGFERNLADRARVAAINESKRGLIPRDQITARAGELVDRDDIINAAIRDGERAVLSEPNRISSWLSAQTRNSPNARLAFGLVQPFMRIPLNAILRAADFSGVGGVKALYKIARGGVRKGRGQSFFRNLEEQRVFARNVASGSFAPAAFLLGMELEESGRLEGYFHTSKRDFPRGRVPTSINIGGENHDINRLGGYVAAPLFIGATFNRLRREGSDQVNALLRSFSGLVQQAPALGYYGAPAKTGRVLTADEPGSELVKEAGGITSGFIPASGAVGAAAKAIDRNRPRKAEGFTGPIMSRLPGLRGQLPEKERTVPLKRAAPLQAKLREYGIEAASIQPMKGEPESLFKARKGRIESWTDRYAAALIANPSFSRLTPDQQKAAIKSLQRNISSESNDREPNLSLFEAGRIIPAIRESERTKAERNKRKIFVEPR